MATTALRFNPFVFAPERDRRNSKESDCVVWHLLKCPPPPTHTEKEEQNYVFIATKTSPLLLENK